MRPAATALLLCLTGCMPPARASGVVVSPADDASQVGWSDQEKSANVVIRNLRQSSEASFHLLRVRTELPRRKHPRSDLVMMVVAGQVEVEVDSRVVPAASGDVIEVPRDVPYAVLNKGRDPAVMYLIHTPSLSADDVRMVTDKKAESSWKWNLWAQ